MPQIFLSEIFHRDKDTKEIVRSNYSKSYDDFYDELESFLNNCDFNNAISLGSYLYKLDFAPSSFKKGKRKSYRLIVAFIKIKDLVLPVKIYKKSNIENIQKSVLATILEEILKGSSKLR